MHFLGKNVATGVYIDLQLWAQCLLARARACMDIYGYSDTSHADSALPVRRTAGTAS